LQLILFMPISNRQFLKPAPNFIIIDSSAVLHRAWHALPKLTDTNHKPINALYGFTVVLLKLLREYQPDYLACAFDTAAPTFRHKLFKEYKATRIPQPQEFYDQIPRAKELLKNLNIKIYEKEGFEADDFIAQLKESAPSFFKIIVSGDMDVFQLIDTETCVYFLRQGIKKIQIYKEEEIKKRFELSPQQLVDYKALRGDPSDNIPGVPGIGDKTAKELLKKFGTLENIYEHLKLPPTSWQIKKTLGENLLSHYSEACLAKKLSILKRNSEISINLKDCVLTMPDISYIKEYFEKLGFKSLIPKIDESLLVKKQKKLL